MKKLLFTFMFAGFSAINFNAQSKVWNFSDAAKFPAGAISTTTTIEGLTFVPEGSNITIATNNLATFSDGYAPTQRVQFGGNSYGGSTNPDVGETSMPTRRYLKFSVSDDASIKFWARGGGSGRSILISDATGKVLYKETFSGSTTSDIIIGSYHYDNEGTPTTLLISTGNSDNSLYKIEYTDNSTLAANSAKSDTKARAYSSGNKIFISGLENKNTEVNIYSLNGQLVKSLKTANDTNTEINGKGIYIVNLKSETGEKSVKVSIK